MALVHKHIFEGNNIMVATISKQYNYLSNIFLYREYLNVLNCEENIKCTKKLLKSTNCLGKHGI